MLCAGLSAYWSGVSPTAPAVQKYEPRLFFPKPTPGLSEIEPRCVGGSDGGDVLGEEDAWLSSWLAPCISLRTNSCLLPCFPAPLPACSTAWNPGILAGIAVPQKPDELFHDMHAYLAAAGGWAGGWVGGWVMGSSQHAVLGCAVGCPGQHILSLHLPPWLI